MATAPQRHRARPRPCAVSVRYPCAASLLVPSGSDTVRPVAEPLPLGARVLSAGALALPTGIVVDGWLVTIAHTAGHGVLMDRWHRMVLMQYSSYRTSRLNSAAVACHSQE